MVSEVLLVLNFTASLLYIPVEKNGSNSSLQAQPEVSTLQRATKPNMLEQASYTNMSSRNLDASQPPGLSHSGELLTVQPSESHLPELAEPGGQSVLEASLQLQTSGASGLHLIDLSRYCTFSSYS